MTMKSITDQILSSVKVPPALAAKNRKTTPPKTNKYARGFEVLIGKTIVDIQVRAVNQVIFIDASGKKYEIFLEEGGMFDEISCNTFE